jgi:hypothetical protein
MTSRVEIAITVNRRPYRLSVPPNRIVADLLREDLLLTGCKIGCDQAVCGACTVLVDDLPVTACTTLAFELDGKAISRQAAAIASAMCRPRIAEAASGRGMRLADPTSVAFRTEVYDR